MESNAPALIHEEGNLIKRAVRDYYTSEVDEILVEGEEAYKSARGHMKNLMPSHVKKVQAYEDTSLPLFQRYQVETMLSAMHDPQVTLKSGGYLVINQAEALVAIDINSGRATRERNIEETALKTILEAAEEIAQQLRQRDLSGLIVIDFIDMESNRNQNAVERKLKEAVRNDRARIQIGSISQFGLIEMSRHRLRPSLAKQYPISAPTVRGRDASDLLNLLLCRRCGALNPKPSRAMVKHYMSLCMHRSPSIFSTTSAMSLPAWKSVSASASACTRMTASSPLPCALVKTRCLQLPWRRKNQKTAAAGGVAARTRTGITAPAPKPKTIQHQSRRQAPKAVMMKTVRTGQSGADGAANAAAESGGVIMRTTKTT